MLINKNTGSVITLDEEMLKHMITTGDLVASIDREISYTENQIVFSDGAVFIEKQFIDDVSNEEIKNGAMEVKKFCFEKNLLDLLEKYIATKAIKNNEFLEIFKELKLNAVNSAYEEAVSQLQKEHIPLSEMLTFETQEREAKAYKESGYNNASLCPTMQIIAQNRGVELKTLCDKALQKAELFRLASAVLIGKRQKLQDEITQAQTQEELAEISIDFRIGE